MLMLSADTSSAKFSVSITDNLKVIDTFKAKEFNRHSSDLIPEIDKLLSKNSINIKDIDVFCVGLGPGSFTGLRIGLTTMRGLSFALSKPIVGIPSMDAIAINVIEFNDKISVIIDAKQNKLYHRDYIIKNNKIIPKTKILLITREDLIKQAKPNTLFTGDGVDLIKSDIINKQKSSKFALSDLWYPKADIIAMLGFERLKKRKKDNVFTLNPLYIYPKECQIRKPKAKKK